MEHGDDEGRAVGFEDEFAYAHFEEAHGEVGGLVDSCFGEDVDPGIVGGVEEVDCVGY